MFNLTNEFLNLLSYSEVEHQRIKARTDILNKDGELLGTGSGSNITENSEPLFITNTLLNIDSNRIVTLSDDLNKI